MESVFRGVATYVFVWLVFRVAGKRSLAQITTFDAVLLLIISETTQAALTDEDNSITNSFLLILTMVGLDVWLSCLKRRYAWLDRFVDGAPQVLMDERGLNQEALRQERVDEEDILTAARERCGIGVLEELQYAILEQSGGITVIPKRQGR
jgi:uncharacterized membrane protein YcaP (DUF421 family)